MKKKRNYPKTNFEISSYVNFKVSILIVVLIIFKKLTDFLLALKKCVVLIIRPKRKSLCLNKEIKVFENIIYCTKYTK